MNGALQGPPDVLATLAGAGIRSVADVLARAECVRDLPGRSNHLLRAGGLTVHVKRAKRADAAREALAIQRAMAAGAPAAALLFHGVDPAHGALTGTRDLAPALPLDDLLRDGALDPGPRRLALGRLAAATAALHGARLHHRDLYLNHVFVDPGDAAGRIAIIDWERLGSHRRPLGRRVIKDLAALSASIPEGSVPRRERARFLLRYLAARGIPRRPVYDRLVRRIDRKAARIRAHLPRTPVGAAARPRGGSP